MTRDARMTAGRIGAACSDWSAYQRLDPLAGIVGALVIANWSYALVRDTGAILLDMSPSASIANKVRAAVETAGDQLIDLHIWRLGPGHFGAIVSVVSPAPQRGPASYMLFVRVNL
jgi:Co/Zn/Cd efflux system component